ncbi:MAG TPA: peptide chain release factor N(5)-glutamine methyltransferase [Chloroflexota bacterium]|nr:peptide chain release factor N(5)-glutamine methyltransferase [Chloroflexota bacterium]
MTLLDLATRRLKAAGSSSPRLDAELLLQHVTGWSREQLLAHPDRPASSAQQRAFEALVDRRARAEPIAYLLGQREFYGRLFKTDRRALIPRPETELLVDIGREVVLRCRAQEREPRVVEVGTGSGAVAISLAAETGTVVVATELSWPALSLARENAHRLGQASRVRFVQSDLLAGVAAPLDIVLANLPYVPSGRSLPRDIADYEPGVAVFAGPMGIELLERLLQQARPFLAPGGQLALELDERAQADHLAAVARRLYPDAEVTVRPDAGGYDRALQVKLPAA